jgi:hypothetical protein
MDSELFYLSPFMEEVCQGQNQYVGDPLFVILLSCYAAATLKKSQNFSMENNTN